MMSVIIRPIKSSEYTLMEDFLYEAIFVPKGIQAPPRDIIKHPDLQIYIENFGKQKGDMAWVAEVEEAVVAMAWSRLMKDYGHLDDETPSLSISLLPAYRHKGIGTKLFKTLLDNLKTAGYQRVSLSVQKANDASKWYLQLGFRVVSENETDYIMDYQF